MSFAMLVCYLEVGTKPKQFFQNLLIYSFNACIIYETPGISGISNSLQFP